MSIDGSTDPEELAGQVLRASRHLFTAGVMSHSGHANLSARLDGGRFLITTSGAARDLGPEQLATIAADGTVLSGKLASENAEIVEMHAVVYRSRSEAGAVIHTHSPAATAFALAHRPLACRAETLLRFGQAEDVPVVPWAPRGSEESVAAIGRVMAEHPTTKVVLLANHGLLAFGPDMMGTARLVVAVEESAEAELAAVAIGGAVDFPAGALDAVRASMARGRP